MLSAAAVENRTAFDEALAEVEAAEASGVIQPDIYLLLLAAEALVEQGCAHETAVLVDRVVADGITLTNASAKRFVAVRNVLRAALTPTLFDVPT